MGAKASTANGANGTTSSGPHHQHHVHTQQHNPQNPRTRTFSSSSSSATELIPGGSSAVPAGFSLLRSIPGMHVTAATQSTIDRQRARSLSSVPDLQQSNGNGTTQSNYLKWSTMLSRIAKEFPSIYHLLSSSYSAPSLLFFGTDVISSETGCQQGDPCGPLSFSITIQPVIQDIKSELNSWYLDDGSIGDNYQVVIDDFKLIIEEAGKLGLTINSDKCELFFVSGFKDPKIVDAFEQVASRIRITEKHEFEILGAPIFEEGYPIAFGKKLETLKLLASRLEGVNAQTAYCLLKNCLFIPKLTYMLRTCAFWKYKSLTSAMDNFLKVCLESIINITIDEIQWAQAGIPISKGGLGIRKITDVCLPAFLSSLHGVRSLVSRILHNMDNQITLHHYNESLDYWNTVNHGEVPENKSIQKQWDLINVERIMAEEINYENVKDIARFKAVQAPESGGWLRVIPSSNIGTAMNDQDFQVCVALRLGVNCYSAHKCICNSLVDESGTHGLSCPNAKGTYPRHVILNQIYNRSLTSARRGNTLEPIGLSRDDGKRPDGVTLAPWSKGKRLIWDVTCVDTLAPSYLHLTSKVTGSAAERACQQKHSHYTKLKASGFLLAGLAFETLGPWCKETKLFVDSIGKMLIEETGDIRAKQFLYNRLSLAIQQGKAASILGTHPTSNKFDEIFKL